jgi:3-hydroxybutyryl-CoA dehydrogenase
LKPEPASAPARAVVIGTGVMGCDIAAIFIREGWKVTCISRDPTKRTEREQNVARSVAQMGGGYEPALFSQGESLSSLDWAGVALVVETVPEDLKLKQSVFAELDKVVPSDIPVASNASGFPISLICEGLKIANRAVGLHFFLPAHLVPLVEVVSGAATDLNVADRVYQIMKSLGRVPVRVKRDTPGFLANRIQHALMREAFAILDEGLASPEDVDAAVRFGFGMRYVAAGPLLQKEFAGLDTQLAAARSIYPALSASHEPSRTLTGLVEHGRLGTKTLHGFWNWTPQSAEAAKRDYEQRLLAVLQLLGTPGTRQPTASQEA